jgi:endoglucanase
MKLVSSSRFFILLSFLFIADSYVFKVQASKPGSLGNYSVSSDSIAPDSSGMSRLNSYEFSKKLGRGWNLGNSLEATGGEIAWGNPKTTQRLIDSVKAAGFNAIRIPVAWSKFSDASSYTIDDAWMTRVEEVVNYALKDSLYVLMNEHWDGGWLQPTLAKQAEANERLAAIWQQVALQFRDYNDHLIFAGTNEVMVDGDYGAPKTEYANVQNGFNQLFVNTVRSTGGKNYYRYLAVQGFNTNINYTISNFTMPVDVVKNKLLVEVHYYDPYDFTINSSSTLYVWGKDAPKSESWANETYADGQFQKMKTKFIDKNCGVLLGEYAAMARLNLGDSLNQVHKKYRIYYTQYITRSLVRHGIVPFFWDSGYLSNNASGLFNRSTGAKGYPDILKAIIDTSVVVSPTTSIQNIKDSKLYIFPNPVNSTLNLQMTQLNGGTSILYDSTGQTIKTLNVKNGMNSFDVSELIAGMYFIKVTTKEGSVIQKFIKD